MSLWDLYNYDNEAENYIKLDTGELGARPPIKSYTSTLSPLYTADDEVKSDELDFDQLDVETKYRFNKSKFFDNFKEPDFTKTDRIPTIKAKAETGSLFYSLGVRPLSKPMKVYKFKTINQDTGAEVISKQKEIEVIGENDDNYYYLTKKGVQSVAKNEVSKQKLDSETLRVRYMQQMNDQAQAMARNIEVRTISGANGKNIIPADIERRDLFDIIPFVEGKSGITPKEIGQKAKSFLYGFGDVLAEPLNFVIDKMVEKAGKAGGSKGYAHNPEYYKKMSINIKNAKISDADRKEIEAKLAMGKEKYPKGYSRETDVMAAGGTKEEIAKARDMDKERSLKAFMGKSEKEKLTNVDKYFNLAGEIVGTVTEMIGLGIAGGTVTKSMGLKGAIKRGVDAVITGGGYGFLEKLKERDATAMETFQNMMSEAAFFGVGGEASRVVGKSIGATKSLTGEVGKRVAKAASFGVAGSGASTLIGEERERNLEDFGTKAAIGAGFELGAGLLTKSGRRGITTKIKRKEIKGKVEQQGTDFENEYGLDQSVVGKTRKERISMAKDAEDKLLNRIGERIESRVGTNEPKAVIEYYKKKYKLDGDIKLTNDLTGDSNAARVEITKVNGKDVIEVRINKDSNPNKIVASIRHEVEHLKDVKEGYTSIASPGNKNPKTLREFMTKEGHHKNVKNFEIDYLEDKYLSDERIDYKQLTKENIKAKELKTIEEQKIKNDAEMKRILQKENYLNKQLKQKVSKARRIKLERQIDELKDLKKKLEMKPVRTRSSLETFDENEVFRNQNLNTNNDQLTNASNLPDYEPPKMTKKEKFKSMAKDAYAKIFNRTQSIDDVSKELKMTNQNYASSHGTVDHILHENLVSRSGKRIGLKSLKDVIIAPKGKQAEFESYLYHKAHVARLKWGKPILAEGKTIMSGEQAIKNIKNYERLYPEFKKASKDYNQMLDDFMREWAVDGGLISSAEYAKLKEMYPNYVPAFRDLEDFATLDKPRNVIANKILQKAIGGNEKLVPLMESLPAYMQKIVRSERRNRIHTEILNAVLKNPEGMKPFAEVYHSASKRLEIKEALKAFEGDDFEATFAKIDNLLIDSAPTKGRFAIVLAEGKPITMKINDKGLWKALTELQKAGTNQKTLIDAFDKYVTKNFKNLITVYNPFFAIRNVARDIPTAYIQGTVNNPAKFIYNNAKSFVEVTKDHFQMLAGKKPKEGLYQQFKSLGGTSGNLTKVEMAFKNKGKTRKTIDKVLEFINVLGSISETMPRYAEFMATYKRGMSKNMPELEVLREALYNSKEVTLNFNRGGTWGKEADKIFPYINAGLQGADKLVRTYVTEGIKTGNFAPLLKSIGVLTLPTYVGYMLLKNKDPERYNKLPSWVIDNYYTLPVSDNEYLRVPKNRESAFVFSSLFDRCLRAAEGDKTAFDDIDFTGSIFNPFKEISRGGVMGAIINISVGGNKDYFGRNIEPTSALLEGTSKQYITKSTTSSIAKAIAPLMAKINISPVQTDYLIDSYFGVLGDIIQGVGEQGIPSIKKMSKLFVNTQYTNKKSEGETPKDRTTRDLSDFEYKTGIKDFKYEIRGEGVKKRKEIDSRIKDKFGLDIFTELKRLRAKKSKASREY